MCKRLFVLFCFVILIVACQPTEKAKRTTTIMTGKAIPIGIQNFSWRITMCPGWAIQVFLFTESGFF